MSCCSNPNVQSSTFSDWCTNCGWAFSYIDNEEATHEDIDTRSFAKIVIENDEECYD